MSIERAEELKKQLTDQWVQVTSTAAEHQRFVNSVGQVRTVNMNCHALVQFFGDKDDSWYDIAPECLTITDKPEAKPAVKARRSVKPSAMKSSNLESEAGTPVAKESMPTDSSSQSPLDAIRSDSHQDKG